MFTLSDHPVHDGLDAERDRFVTLSVQHRARNNLRADHRAQVKSLAGAIAQTLASGSAGHTTHHVQGELPEALASSALPNSRDEPLYECRLVAQRAAVPVRIGAIDEHADEHADGHALPDVRLQARATIHGAQTAVVVGAQAPLHTDRDHRIKVQFHWQRGGNASHRLGHSARSDDGSDNAPASDASGTWVRVAQSVAGANWGGAVHAAPGPGGAGAV